MTGGPAFESLAVQVAEEVRAGRRVLVATASRRESAAVQDAVVQQLAGDAVRGTRSPGNMRIVHPSGGWAVFGPVASDLWRGRTADTLALTVPPTDDQLAGIMPSLATAADPRVIR